MADIKGKDTGGPKASNFKSSGTTPQGYGSAQVVQGVIVDVNTNNFTVDVASKYDRRRWFDIQVGSPYLHYNNGEGLYVVPEVGAKCEVCIPADGSEPFVLCFIAPLETTGAQVVTNSDGTTSLVDPSGAVKPNATGASFAAGRRGRNPGDIVAQTRDGNFLILHRGGAVSIGATELSQRLYIPLGNIVADFSERYAHHNVGGSIHWGLQEKSIDNPHTEHTQVFRVFANDRFADLRITTGGVSQPIGERAEDETVAKLAELDMPSSDIVMEVVVAPDGFVEDSGDVSDQGVKERTLYRYFLDRQGNVFTRLEGNGYLFCRKRLVVRAVEGLSLTSKDIELSASDKLHGEGGVLDLNYRMIKLGTDAENRRPLARMGDPVAVVLPPAVQISGTLSGSPFTGVITILTPLFGSITGGNTGLLG